MPFWTKARRSLTLSLILAAFGGALLGHTLANHRWLGALVTAYAAGLNAGLGFATLVDIRLEPVKDDRAAMPNEEQEWRRLLERTSAPRKPGGF